MRRSRLFSVFFNKGDFMNKHSLNKLVSLLLCLCLTLGSLNVGVFASEVNDAAEQCETTSANAAEAPSEEAQSEEVPSEETPSEETPSEEAPSEVTPSEDVPSEEVPNEEVPNEEAPSDETYSEELSDEEAAQKQREADEYNERLLNSPYMGFYTAARTAALVNAIQTSEIYERALRTVLNYYYTNYNAARIAAFSENCDERAAQTLADYAAAHIERENDSSDYVAGEVLVLFNDVQLTQLDEDMLTAMGLCVRDSFGEALKLNIAVVTLPLEYTVERGCALLNELEFVQCAIPNSVQTVDTGETDATAAGLKQPQAPLETQSLTAPADQWKYRQSHIDKINTLGAWELLEERGHATTRIAVIDTGADMDHPDLGLSLNRTLSRDLAENTDKVLTHDYNGHGTHVSGIIAASAYNGIGTVGVASGPNNDYVDLVVISASHTGTFYGSDLAQAINYAVANGCRVINMSLGGRAESSDDTAFFKSLIDSATAQGTLVVCSAGNDNTDAEYLPSDIDTAMSVISTDNYTNASSNARSEFSNYGAAKDISAPGSYIYSTLSSHTLSYDGADYGYMSGTSMAAPIVTAVAALVLDAVPTLTPQQVMAIIEDTATDLYTSGFDVQTAWGNINAEAAVARAYSLASEPDETPSSFVVTSQPSKTEYFVGQPLTCDYLDLNGLALTATYASGAQFIFRPATIQSLIKNGALTVTASGDSFVAGANTLTFTYKTKTASVSLTGIACEVLALGKHTQVQLSPSCPNKYMTFTAPRSGYYSFYSLGSYDTCAKVYKRAAAGTTFTDGSTFAQLACEDDSDAYNFAATELFANEGDIFYLRVYFWYSTSSGSFDVGVLDDVNKPTAAALYTYPTRTTLPVGAKYLPQTASGLFNGLKLRLRYIDGSVEDLSGTQLLAALADGSASLKVGDGSSDAIQAGNNTVTLDYNGRAVSYNIVGAQNTVSSIDVVSPATYYSRAVGAKPSYTGLSVRVNYSSGTSKLVSESNLTSAFGGYYFSVYNSPTSWERSRALGAYGGYHDDTLVAGKNTYTIEYLGKTATFEIYGVEDFVAPTSLRLNVSSAELALGAQETVLLSASQLPVGANARVQWSCGDTQVATVDENGLVSAVGIGSTVITARANNRTAKCTVRVRRTLEAAWFETEYDETTYDGTAHIPVLSLAFGAPELALKSDYTVEYSDNVNAGTAKVTITGKSDYTGTAQLEFEIQGRPLHDDMLRLSNTQVFYTGGAVTPLSLYDGQKLLVEGTDYALDFTNSSSPQSGLENTQPGRVSVSVSGRNNYTGVLAAQFDILPLPLADTMVAAIPAQDYVPGALEVTPTLEVAFGERTLIEGVDYDVEYRDNTAAGTASAVITGKGFYEGTAQKSFVINRRALTSAMLADVGTVVYSGSALEPLVLTDSGVTLVRDVDYTVSYRSNVNVGTASAVITGIGSYRGTLRKSFRITPLDIADGEVSATLSEDSFAYKGSQIKPLPSVEYNGSALRANVNYTVSYVSNINAGTAQLVIKGRGNFGGTRTLDFTIVPKVTTFAVLAAAQTYNGAPLEPKPTVRDGAKTLKAGVDYTVAYLNNTDATTQDSPATVQITGIGNYAGSAGTAGFAIKPLAISRAALTLPTHVQLPDSGDALADIKLSLGSQELTPGEDYTLAYANANRVGTARVTVTGAGNFSGTMSRSYRVVSGKVLGDCVIAEIAPVVYSGAANKPAIDITYGGEQLTLSRDYTAAYSSNVNAGRAKVVLTGRGQYAGVVTVYFEILKKPLETDSGIVFGTLAAKTYTGAQIKPTLTVKDGSRTLSRNVHYTLAWSNNTDVTDSAVVTVVGKGNYSGSSEINFEIAPMNVNRLSVSAATRYYTGEAVSPNVTVKLGRTVCALRSDYTVSGETDNTALSTSRIKASFTLNGTGNFTGSRVVKYTIARHPLTSTDITFGGIPQNTVYNGTAQTFPLVVSQNGDPLVENTDYYVRYYSNQRVGTASVYVYGKGSYTGTKRLNFAITGRQLIADALSDVFFTGSKLTPLPTVRDSETNAVLRRNTDYTLKYTNNLNAGVGTITVVGRGNYAKATCEVSFNILQKTAALKISSIRTQTYNGRPLTPSVVVRCGSRTLKYGVDYVVGYTHNVYAGTADVFVNGVGNYSAQSRAEQKFSIVLPSVALTKAVNTGGGSAALTWKPAAGADGYVVEYSLSSRFTNSSRATFAGGSLTTGTIPGLTPAKTYYFRVSMYNDAAQSGPYGAYRGLRVSA